MAVSFISSAKTFLSCSIPCSNPLTSPHSFCLDNKRHVCRATREPLSAECCPIGLTKRNLALSLAASFFVPLSGKAAILEADDDEELLERVKKDRQKRIERQGVINSSKLETGYLQDLVYRLSEVGKAIEDNNLKAASSVLGSNSKTEWIKKANSALNKISVSPEQKAEVESFKSSISNLISSGKSFFNMLGSKPSPARLLPSARAEPSSNAMEKAMRETPIPSGHHSGVPADPTSAKKKRKHQEMRSKGKRARSEGSGTVTNWDEASNRQLLDKMAQMIQVMVHREEQVKEPHPDFETLCEKNAKLEEVLRERAVALKECQKQLGDREARIAQLESEHAKVLARMERDQAKALKEARTEGTIAYAKGYRNANRATYQTMYVASLYHKMTVAQLAARGIEFELDTSNTLGFSLDPPPYRAPPTGTFIDDGEEPLEAWDMTAFNPNAGVVPGQESALPSPLEVFDMELPLTPRTHSDA